MAGNRLKKTNLLFVRTELGEILRELVELGIIDVSEPSPLNDDPELVDSVKSEVIDLGPYGANRESITALGTDSTLYLTGWITAKSENPLAALASRHTCAWEFEDPPTDALDDVPVKLIRPSFLRRFYRGSRKLFSPLSSAQQGAITDESEPEGAPED